MSVASSSAQRGAYGSSATRPPNFLISLWTLLAKSPPSPYLFWSECGHFVLIPDEDTFVEQVARVQFNQGTIASFNKQMNNWGFLRAPRARAHSSLSKYDPNTRVWKHESLLQSSSIQDVQRVQRRPDGLSKKRKAPKRIRRDYKNIAPVIDSDERSGSTGSETSGASSPLPVPTTLADPIPLLPMQLGWASSKSIDFEQASKSVTTTATAYAPWPAAYFHRNPHFSPSEASSASSFDSPTSDRLTSPQSYDIELDPGLVGDIGYASLFGPIGHGGGAPPPQQVPTSDLALPTIRHPPCSESSSPSALSGTAPLYTDPQQSLLNFSSQLATLTQLEASPPSAPSSPSASSNSVKGKALSRDPSFGYARAPGWSDAMLSGPLSCWNGLGTSDSSQG